MLLLLVFFPLLSFFSVLLFGRFLGKWGTAFLTCFFLFLSLLFSFYFFGVALTDGVLVTTLLSSWFFVGFFSVNWEFLFDPLSLSMLSMISFISFFVHLYSVDYMSADPHFIRFMSYLSLFTFFMFVLITASSYVQLFIGWEGVGLCSYLLVNFWYTRLFANYSAMKAVFVNRIGDFGLTFAIILMCYYFSTSDFILLSLLASSYHEMAVVTELFTFSILDLISIFIFLGAVGKSAQLGLHTWLPEAMEGPTPVSALIHAATMVTAGVFVLIRSSFLLEFTTKVLPLIAVWGACTAFFASLVGAFQYDLKRIIAYSTCSQLGYMVFSCGLSNYNIAMFHLVNHAFFKALLFLGAGSVIHAFLDEQDIRKMGGLWVYLPFTYTCMLVGNLALIGFPFLSGFYSKDILIELTFVSFDLSYFIALFLALSAAFFTAYYSIKALLLVFMVPPRGPFSAYLFSHEPSWCMSLSLIFLAFFSIFFGEIFQDIFLLGDFWNHFLAVDKAQNFLLLEDFIYPFAKNYAFIITLSGLMMSAFLCLSFDSFFFFKLRVLVRPFIKKFWFDAFWSRTVVRLGLTYGYKAFFVALDKGVYEYIGYKGLFLLGLSFLPNLKSVQSGYIYNYATLIIIGLLLLSFL